MSSVNQGVTSDMPAGLYYMMSSCIDCGDAVLGIGYWAWGMAAGLGAWGMGFLAWGIGFPPKPNLWAIMFN